MTSLQIKLGRFCENSNAASLALSIKGAEGFCERACAEFAGADAAGGGSGQGGRSGCFPRFKMGGASEQAGVSWDCDWVAGGGGEGDCAGCDCGGDALCTSREIGALRTRASSAPLGQLDLRHELKLRMIHSHDLRFRFCLFAHRQHTPTASLGASRFAFQGRTVPWRSENEVTALGMSRIPPSLTRLNLQFEQILRYLR